MTRKSISLRQVIFVIILASAGCGKKAAPPVDTTVAAPAEPAAPDPAAPPSANAAAPVPASPPDPVPAAPNQAPVPIAGTVHPFMTDQLRLFIQMKGRMPNSFSEFAGARMDSVPRPPKGFRWEIDQTTQEVKLVPK